MDAEFSEINITPFTDVLLVLLVIFMILAALVLPPGFERKLPCNCAAPISDSPQASLTVAVSRAGELFVDGVKTTQTGIYAMLARAHGHNARAKVQIVADAHARYGLVIRVLDASKEAGLNDVTFVTE